MKHLLIVTVMAVLVAVVGIIAPFFLIDPVSPLAVDALDTRAVAAGDYDADGDLDLYVVNYGARNQLFRNTGGELVLQQGSAAGTHVGYGFDAAWGDMDGDGDLDLAVANSQDADNELYRMESFAAAGGGSNFFGGSGSGVGGGDDDDDDDHHAEHDDDCPDGAEGHPGDEGDGEHEHGKSTKGSKKSSDSKKGSESKKGSGKQGNGGGGGGGGSGGEGASGELVAITSGPVVSDGGDSHAVAWGDLDGDGDADLTFANRSGGNFLYWNDGIGGFVRATEGPVSTDDGRSRDVVLGDLDGDADLELLFANSNDQRNFIYTNQGGDQGGVEGTFARLLDDPAAEEQRKTYGLSLCDFDADGDLDLLSTNRHYDLNTLYRNDGGSSFTPATDLAPSQDAGDSYCSVWGDMDSDGDPELLVVNGLGPNFLYVNQGGVFSRVTKGQVVEDAHNSRCAVLADFDGDGLPELVVGNSVGERNVLLRNLSQLEAVTNLVRPTPAPDHDARGQVELSSSPYLGHERFSVVVSKVALAVPHDLYLEHAPGAGTYGYVATLSKANSKLAYKVDTSKGQSLPLAADSLFELMGRRIEVRSLGLVVLHGVVSAYGSDQEQLDGSTYMVRSEDDVGGTTTGTVRVLSLPYKSKAIEQLEVTVVDAPPGTYRLFLEEASGLGSVVDVGPLSSLSGKLQFKADLTAVDALPLPGIASVGSLLNRTVEVRAAGTGDVLLQGFVPVAGVSQATRRGLAKLSPVDVQVGGQQLALAFVNTGWATVEVRSIASLGDERFEVVSAQLPAGAAPFQVYLESTAGGGPMVRIGALELQAGGRSTFKRHTKFGQPLPLGARFAAELIGRRIEIRAQAGPTLLSGTVPAFAE